MFNIQKYIYYIFSYSQTMVPKNCHKLLKVEISLRVLSSSRQIYFSSNPNLRMKGSKDENINNKFIYKKFFENHTNKNHISGESKFKSGTRIVSAELSNQTTLPIMSKKHIHKEFLEDKEIVFGLHPVYLALLQQKRQLIQLFIKRKNENTGQPENVTLKDNIEKLAFSLGIPVKNLNSQILNYLPPGAVHQGVCLEASPLPLPEYIETENADERNEVPLWLILNKILDPMNVGAIIRSAYYFGVERIFTVKGHSCRLSPTVSKASSGALELINISQLNSLEDFILARKESGWSIISTVPSAEFLSQDMQDKINDVSKFQVLKPSALILGSEGKGISSYVMNLCDALVSIYPRQNLEQGIDSLNVSVAAGIILHSLKASVKTSKGIDR